jgi:hypothetical protein
MDDVLFVGGVVRALCRLSLTADPSPELLGCSDWSGGTGVMATAGDRLYFLGYDSGESGVWIADAPAGGEPVPRAFVAATLPVDLAVEGSTLVVAGRRDGQTGGWLMDLDVADPAHPVVRQRLDLAGRPSHVRLTSDRAYVAFGGSANGVTIFDRHTGGRWKPVGTVSFPNTAAAVVIRDHWAFVAGQQPDGLLVVDVSDENQPRLASFVPIPGVRDMVAYGNAALALTAAGITVVDLTDPVHPGLTYHRPLAPEPYPPFRLFTGGERLYISYEDGGISVVEVDTVPDPTVTPSPTPEPSATPGAPLRRPLWLPWATG